MGRLVKKIAGARLLQAGGGAGGHPRPVPWSARRVPVVIERAYWMLDA
jgi:hypothetical protein